MKNIYSFIKKYCGSGKILLFLILQGIFAVVNFMSPEVFKNGVNAIEDKSRDGLIFTLILAVASTVVYLALDFFIKIYLRKLINKAEKELETELLGKALDLKIIARQKIDSGKFLTVAVGNSSAAVESCLYYLADIFCGMAMIVFSLLYMGAIQWQIMLAIVVYNVIWRAIAVKITNKMKKNSEETVLAVQKSNSFLFNILYNMLTVRVYNKQQFFNDKWFTHEENVLKKSMKRFIWSNGFQDSTWAMVKLSEFLILYGMGGAFVYYGYTTIGVLLALTFAVDLMAKGIEKVTDAVYGKAEAEANIEAVNSLLKNPDTESGEDKEIKEENFAVSVRDLSFSFGDKKVLKNVSFDIKFGERVLICGENGGGKSTLLNLICGIYKPDSGSISYGSCDTTFINLKSMAKNYAYISQESNIIDSNIFENVALSEEYDKEKIIDILNKLGIENVIQISPLSASQGEKQRINIARAVYNAKEVCILAGDEIFSNVDNQNALKITEILDKVFYNKTVIFVAHTKMNMKFDKVLTVESGAVKEVRKND